MSLDTSFGATRSQEVLGKTAQGGDWQNVSERDAPVASTGMVHKWLAGKISSDLTRKLEKLAASEDVVRVAVMPDIHEGPSVPNGCVIATRRFIYPEAVGKDIGCGISAIQFGWPAENINKRALEAILRGLTTSVPALKHPRARAVSDLPESCAANTLSNNFLAKTSQRDGVLQLGTMGRGNHFVELQQDMRGMLWAMVHSGSRGMGEAITSFHLQRATRSSVSGLAFLDLTEDAGQSYYCDMKWAKKYATESRLLILNRVADLVERELGAALIEDTYIDSPHNFARVEDHFGEQLIIHRKSANSAREGELGIIPGSMSTGSRIVTGRGNAEALHSSAHGAGRAMSRKVAAQNINAKTLTAMMRGIVYQNERAEHLRDEAPGAYKNLNEVMQAQVDLVRTENTLSTILNYKGI